MWGLVTGVQTCALPIFLRVDRAASQLSLSVKLSVTPAATYAEICEAFNIWLDGDDFKSLSEHALETVDIGWLEDVNNPWLWLFLAKNMRYTGRFDTAALCSVHAVPDKTMAGDRKSVVWGKRGLR